MDIQNETIIKEATFNNKVKTYIFFVVLWFLIISIVGLIIVPFWIFGLGQWISKLYFYTLKCQLTNKNLKFSKGLIIHIEKTIPLENIQDLSFVGGPVLRYFGLTLIRIETAGSGGSSHNNNMMSMLGINDSEAFKNSILNQREIVIREKFLHNESSTSISSLSETLLADIKSELTQIKEALQK